MRRPYTPVAVLFAILLGSASPATTQASEVRVRGLLDLVLADLGPSLDLNLLTRGDSPFDNARLRIFADASISDRLQVFSQVVLGDATNPYIDGAYLSFTPYSQRDLHALVGKVPWAIGTYAPRTYSDHNPRSEERRVGKGGRAGGSPDR